ncbi:hypothetical protein ES692_05950 [Psychroserpens burtonensis]|uniref:Uncharacterized protein n=2 Tax=Psychroserpens burtonensis TaxID=49278 RepID=A0A5C7BGS8_9FLAO|nr:hypothetical protein ES692_05950 [Psychroserpens burtonensis]
MFLTITSCSDKIDGASDESYKESLEKLKSNLNDDEKAKFNDALKKIAFSDINSFSDLKNLEGIVEGAKVKLDGMTYVDVINEGDRMQKIIDDKNKEQAKLEVKELYAKMRSSQNDSIKLSSFKVEKSRFYKRKSGVYVISYEPVIDLIVLNNTNQAISRAYFTGTIKSPERTVPWLVKEFNYKIAGGLEPGEKDNWKLAPNSYSDWGSVDSPKDAIFTVTVTKLDGVDGEELFSIDFDEDDKERLNELINDYPEFIE